MIKKSLLCLLFIACSAASLFSQNEGRIWYFGNLAGLDFGTTPPSALTGALATTEGCATICDASGNLLFYTDGQFVYDKNHTQIQSGLYGNGSSTQSGIIVKKPGSSTLYYIFTADAYGGTQGINYSIVDMSLNGGLGQVTTVNSPVYQPSCEKITAIRHCNGTDYWILSHEVGTNNFRAYLLTSTGLSSTPVITGLGTTIPANDVSVIGQMKCSPNGRSVALALYDPGTPHPVELYDFDPSTGILSNYVPIDAMETGYGIEFSGDGTKLYATDLNTDNLHQWSICAGSATAIAASHYSLTMPTNTAMLGALQLAQDGKIYISRYGADHLSVINAPNLAGSACNFVDYGPSLGNNSGELGLPNFISNIFANPGPFTYTPGCLSATFTPPAANTSTIPGCTIVSNSITGVTWDFGDPSSGSQNTSTNMNATHSYTATGTYTVKLTIHYQCSNAVQQQTVQIASGAPVLALAGNFSICAGNSTTLSATGATTYSWSTGATTNSIVVKPNSNAQFVVYGWGNNQSCTTYSIINVKVDKCTGIEEQSGQMVDLFPNPTSGLLHIVHQKPVSVTIHDIFGKTIYNAELPVQEQQIDLSTYEHGLYFVKVSDGESWKIYRIQKAN